MHVQWDPERDVHRRRLRYRSLQFGLSGDAVRRYADEWTVALSDATPPTPLVRDGDPDAAEHP